MNFNAVASVKLQSHVISPESLLQSEISKSNVKIQEDWGTTTFPLCQNSTINSLTEQISGGNNVPVEDNVVSCPRPALFRLEFYRQ